MTFSDLIANLFKERGTTSFYRAVAVSFLGWNWKVFFILFVESEVKIEGLRTLKVEDVLLDFETSSLLGDVLVNGFWIFLPPLFFSYLLIYQLPRLINFTHSTTLDFEFDRKEMRIKRENKLSKLEEKKFIQEKKTKQEEVQAKEFVDKHMTEEDKWLIEFDNEVIKNKKLVAAIWDMKNVFYLNGGYIHIDANNRRISADYISRIDTLGLIDLSTNQFDLTKKGKFFIREAQKRQLEVKRTLS